MNPTSDGNSRARRRSSFHLFFPKQKKNIFLSGKIIDEGHSIRQVLKSFISFEKLFKMNKSTRRGLIGIAVLVCGIVSSFIINELNLWNFTFENLNISKFNILIFLNLIFKYCKI